MKYRKKTALMRMKTHLDEDTIRQTVRNAGKEGYHAEVAAGDALCTYISRDKDRELI